MAMVALSDEHTAILDAIAKLHYNIPRTRMIAYTLDATLPVILDEMAAMHPDKTAEIAEIRRMLRNCGETVERTRAKVIDLNERRHLIRERLQRERL